MLTMTSDDATGLVEVTVDGSFAREDFERIAAELERLFEAHSQLNVVEVIRQVDVPFDPGLWWRDLRWGFDHIHKFARVAVVTDSGWIGPLTRAIGALMPSEIRTYPSAQIDAARLWAAERR